MPTLSNTFRLTPNLDITKALDVLRKANFVLPLTGFDSVYTSWGDNLNKLAQFNQLQSSMRLEMGPAALEIAPEFTASSQLIRIPKQSISINGLVIPISGKAPLTPTNNSDYTISTATYANGKYAIVFEYWLALVGPSTKATSGGTPPITVTYPAALAPGIADSVNKPAAPPNYNYVYPQGHIDRVDATTNLATGELVDTLAQTRKFLQPQWRIRVITERDLVGTFVGGGTTGIVYTNPSDSPLTPYGVIAQDPISNAAADAVTKQAFDGKFYSVKLAILDKTSSSTGTIYTEDTVPSNVSIPYIGQPPIPVAKTRIAITKEYKAADANLQTQVSTISNKVTTLENADLITRMTTEESKSTSIISTGITTGDLTINDGTGAGMIRAGLGTAFKSTGYTGVLNLVRTSSLPVKFLVDGSEVWHAGNLRVLKSFNSSDIIMNTNGFYTITISCNGCIPEDTVIVNIASANVIYVRNSYVPAAGVISVLIENQAGSITLPVNAVTVTVMKVV